MGYQPDATFCCALSGRGIIVHSLPGAAPILAALVLALPRADLFKAFQAVHENVVKLTEFEPEPSLVPWGLSGRIVGVLFAVPGDRISRLVEQLDPAVSVVRFDI